MMSDSSERSESDDEKSRKGDYKKAYAIKNLQLEKRFESLKEG